MKYDFENLAQRENTASVKWNKNSRRAFSGNENAHPFWVADMEFKASDEIMEEAKTIANSGSYGYPHFSNLKKSFLDFVKLRHNLDLKRDQVTLTIGVLASISIMIELLFKKGDKIVIPYPAYKPFITIAEAHELEIVPLFLEQNGNTFSLNLKTLESLCEDAKALLFCSPHNPTGIVFTEEELKSVAKICKKNNVFIISDEIHCDLIYKGKQHHSLVTVCEEIDTPAMVAMAPSKTFNIAGEHFSVALFNDKKYKDLYDKFCKKLFIASSSYYSTSLAKTAYEKGYPWLMEVVDVLKSNLEYIEDYCKNYIPEILPIKTEASFIGLWDCSKLLPLIKEDAEKNPELYDLSKASEAGLLSLFFGQRANIVVNDGSWFGSEVFEKYIRFNFATNKKEIKLALDNVKEAVNKLKAGRN